MKRTHQTHCAIMGKAVSRIKAVNICCYTQARYFSIAIINTLKINMLMILMGMKYRSNNLAIITN